ncbi:hypothetical protein ACVIW0_004275 [Bradyrhizobium sp. USDA 4454]
MDNSVRVLSTVALKGAVARLAEADLAARRVRIDAAFAPILAVFSAGRMTTSARTEAADRLLRYLSSADVAPVLRETGLEP